MLQKSDIGRKEFGEQRSHFRLQCKGPPCLQDFEVARYLLLIVPYGRFRVFIFGTATHSTSFSLILSFRKHHLNNMAPKKTEGKLCYANSSGFIEANNFTSLIVLYIPCTCSGYTEICLAENS